MSLAVKNLDYEIGNERILDQISLEIKEGWTEWLRQVNTAEAYLPDL